MFGCMKDERCSSTFLGDSGMYCNAKESLVPVGRVIRREDKNESGVCTATAKAELRSQEMACHVSSCISMPAFNFHLQLYLV